VDVCSSCGITLSFAPAEPAAESASADEALACLTSCEAWAMREIAADLERAGIAGRVDSWPPGGSLAAGRCGLYGFEPPQVGIYVRPGDLTNASRRFDAYQRERMPGPEADDFAAPGTLCDACPACGAPLDARSAACPGCGIEFPETTLECSVCHAEVDPEAERCASCGVELRSEFAAGPEDR